MSHSTISAKTFIQPIDVSAAPAPQPPPIERRDQIQEDQNVFCKRGDDWEIQFRGGSRHPFQDLDGLLYLWILVAHPSRRYTAQELNGCKNQYRASPEQRSTIAAADLLAESLEADRDVGRGFNFSMGAGPVLDQGTRQQCWERLQEIEEELREANASQSMAKCIGLQEEKDYLVRELKAAVGYHGREVELSSEVKKARDKVRNAITRAIAKIGKKDSALARHLQNSIKFQPVFAYSPEVPTNWTC